MQISRSNSRKMFLLQLAQLRVLKWWVKESGASVWSHTFLPALSLLLYFTCECGVRHKKPFREKFQCCYPKGLMATCTSGPSHTSAIEVSCVPAAQVVLGCALRTSPEPGWQGHAEISVRAVVSIKPQAGCHLLSLQPKQSASPLRDWGKRKDEKRCKL